MSERVTLTATMSRDVRKLRAATGMSQYRLADLTGLTRPKVKRIEKREILSVAKADMKALLDVLQGTRPSTKKSSNGVPRKKRKTRTSTSGRAKVTSDHAAPELDETMRARVEERVLESVLDVMRDVIGEAGRVLVEKHNLHDVTLGRLFQVDA